MAASVGAFGAAEAQASGKIFACYSKSTKVLTHATSRHCKKGFKSQSWNKLGLQGPQGAKGAQGAQGPAGAVAGYDKYNSAASLAITHGTSAVVLSVTPAAAGNYAVQGFANALNAHAAPTSFKCGITNLHRTSTTPQGGATIASNAVGMGLGMGIVHASPGSPIQLGCHDGGQDVTVVKNHAALTAVQLATANGHAAALHQQAIANRFSH